jgi:phosphatidylglycerol---prolipoprotein diacylglyceryl transferase
MYPDLSYLFHDLLGTAPDNWISLFKTFGFFLAVAFLVSAVVYYRELKRKALEGHFVSTPMRVVTGAPASMTDIVTNAVVGFIFLGKGVHIAQNYDRFRTDPAAGILSMEFHWLAGVAGAVFFAGLIWWDARRKQLPEPKVSIVQAWPHDRISEITVWAAVGGILGAKLFDLFDNWEAFLRDPLGSLLSGGGLAFFGGLILGFVAVVWFQWRLKIPFLHAADAIAPALTAGYGVGRIGCQASGDGDWGVVNLAPKPDWMGFLPDWMWAYRYPHNVLKEGVPIEGCQTDYCRQLAEPVWPTPFYETMMMLVIFGILWSLRKRIKIPGLLFFIYLGLIGIERFLIEKIRVNVKYESMGQFTQAEIIAMALMAISVVGMVYLWQRSKKTPDTGTSGEAEQEV